MYGSSITRVNRYHSIKSGFQIPSRPLAIGPLFLLWANQVDIKGSPHCECIKAKLSFRKKNTYFYILQNHWDLYKSPMGLPV